jgi:hypothetical protein
MAPNPLSHYPKRNRFLRRAPNSGSVAAVIRSWDKFHRRYRVSRPHASSRSPDAAVASPFPRRRNLASLRAIAARPSECTSPPRNPAWRAQIRGEAHLDQRGSPPARAAPSHRGGGGGNGPLLLLLLLELPAPDRRGPVLPSRRRRSGAHARGG